MRLHEFFEMWERIGDRGRCFYCGIALLHGDKVPEAHPHFRTRDHFIPKSRMKLWANVSEEMHHVSPKVMSCFACNNIKGNHTPERLRSHVKHMNGADQFFCEIVVGTVLKNVPEYVSYCKAVAKYARQEHLVQTRRSLEAVEARRAAGLLPEREHKNKRRKAMRENIWWDAMNSLGKLIWNLEQNGIHPELADHLRVTITSIKSNLPEQFTRKNLAEFNPENINDLQTPAVGIPNDSVL